MESEGKCNLCLGNTELVYEPKKSLIGLQILICKKCGFVQSEKSSTEKIAPGTFEIQALSCDSDYSPVRVGKQQMTNVDIQNLEALALDGIANFEFLDMASARGHFALWASSKSKQKVVCLEPDEYMIDNYADGVKIQVHIGDYREVELATQFDFIYSCHTLEHFRSPILYLNFVNSHLKANGLFYVNVPNLHGILDVVTFDDFFYDKHRVYFDPATLRHLLQGKGFEVIAEWLDVACIRLLARKVEKVNTSVITSNYQHNLDLITKYKSELSKSRASLPSLINLLNSRLNRNSVRILLGCGRMLDALVSYGHLNLNDYDYLVDNFLGLATKTLYSRDLYTIDSLPTISGPLQVVVVARTANSELGIGVLKKFPHAELVYFAEIANA